PRWWPRSPPPPPAMPPRSAGWCSTIDFRRRTGARLSAAASAPNEPGPTKKTAPEVPGAAPASPARPDRLRVDESALVISLADFAEEWRRFGDGAAKSEPGDAGATPPPLEPEAAGASVPGAAGRSRTRRVGLRIAAIGCVAAAAAALALGFAGREPPSAPVSVAGSRAAIAPAPAPAPPIARAAEAARALP